MHRARIVFAFAVFLFASVFEASAQEWRETSMPGVEAQLAYLRQYNSVLHLGILLRNSVHKRAVGAAIVYSDVVIIDNAGRKKYLPQKDADGRFIAGPISNWVDGGRWYPEVTPSGEVMLWADFDAIPATGPVVIQTPLTGQITASISQVPPTDTSISSPLTAVVTSATRSEGQFNVTLKITNPDTRGRGYGAVVFQDVYALDAQGKRRYPLLKDSSGTFVAEPKSNTTNGGRWYLPTLKPGGSALLNLTFQAPPNSVRAVDLVVPPLAPFENVQIAGEGTAKEGGLAIAGSSVALQGALKDLGAEVTPETIKVNLSADLLFDFDKSDVKPEAESSLGKVVTVLKSYPAADVTVDGHADAKGSESYNQNLSEARAKTVARWLVAHASLREANVHTKGWGKSQPVAPNTNADGSDNPEGRAKNRRVEITVKRNGK